MNFREMLLDENALIRSVVEGLWDQVGPQLRIVLAKAEGDTIRLRFYFDGDPSEEDIRSARMTDIAVSLDFGDYERDMTISRLDAPIGISTDGTWLTIFSRRERVEKTGYDALMNEVCVGMGFCGSIVDDEPRHVDMFIPPDGLVSADQFTDFLLKAEGMDPDDAESLPYKSGIRAAFVRHMNAEAVDARNLRWRDNSVPIESIASCYPD